jgi:pimeloyl-ACP methyl ester carboxylesterase
VTEPFVSKPRPHRAPGRHLRAAGVDRRLPRPRSGGLLAIVVPFAQGRPLPAWHYDDVRCPTLVITGGRSPEHLRNAQEALAAAVPGSELRVLPGQSHTIKPKVVAAVVLDHLTPPR